MPSEEHFAEIGGLRMHYSQAGKGRPLLLIHGLLGGSFCWRFNVPALAKEYSVYTVDLPGSGLSDAPPQADCSMEAQAARLLQFIREMDLSDLSVIGASWGGAIALLLAAVDAAESRSRKIRSLVLCAPVTPWSPWGRKRIEFLNKPLGGYLLRMIWPVSRPVHALALKRMYGDPARISPGSRKGYASMILRPARARNMLNVLRSWRKDLALLEGALLQGPLGRVKVPTLLAWGSKDGAVDIRSAGMLRHVLPHCELLLFPGVGHLPFEEIPDEFNERVLAFLSKN
jgi:pimeloyl-ACP methyl ester carboxylesterase